MESSPINKLPSDQPRAPASRGSVVLTSSRSQTDQERVLHSSATLESFWSVFESVSRSDSMAGLPSSSWIRCLADVLVTVWTGPVAAAPWAVRACISKLAPRKARPQTVPGGVDSVVPFVRMAREGRSCDAGQLNPPTTGCDGSQPSTSEAAFVIGEKGSPNNKHALLALNKRSVSRCCRGSSRSPDSVKGATSNLPAGSRRRWRRRAAILFLCHRR